ncbi:ead/Ea22-like family protein [Salmonella enterica subsp. enterica serovar Heidelberg]|uniref:ead/Ea22-like family protein n=1 Tax=Salmonella enterica TaxID=28901 RepID=UPI001CABD940|nr:ead/Ea22-like family protein [Salmonella enterica]EBC9695741.1 ead/Ea22-like family protein [Salmonella enterica subsp. enterica serovar Heidelberg]EBE3883941.1 ead/Ea22-like family protein [Salmonella enterica subsp. enterica serovar Heidelberg]EBF2662769.1 ead/Ea22-like family protein [Salmonella enterica subsp. enterica serovar Heidelberg]EBF8269783.1 ead/Ea22-like family protein [Salmonella enterica subsp. enterica serovar Heidelberg]EEF5850695.1 ead/Ea22-like family protein [Salmonella
MTALNKQALREAAIHAQASDDWGYDDDNFHDKATPDAVLMLLDELEAAEERLAELQSKSMRPVAWMRSNDITTFGPIFTKNENYAVEQWGDNAVALYASPVNFKLACFTDERNLKYINERGRETSLIWSERNSENGDVQLFRAAGIGVKGE